MKRQLREVGDGSLRRPGKLRRGDELVDFFEAFEDMIDRLRIDVAAVDLWSRPVRVRVAEGAFPAREAGRF
jgi:hypothetical protein